MSNRLTHPTLSVDADLRMEVGGRSATLTGSGSRLTLRSDTPQMFLSSLNDVALPDWLGNITGPRAVGRAAELLVQYGLAFHVEGSSGTIAALGAGEHSWWGRVATGSSAVRLGSFRALLPMVGAAVSPKRVLRAALPVGAAVSPKRVLRAALPVGAVAGILAAVVAARRRHSGSDE